MLFQFVQVIYWLALSSWFGGALFITSAAQIIFRTLREYNPVLPQVLSVNLEGKHSILLGGSVVGNLTVLLRKWGLFCGILLVLTIGAEWFILDVHDSFTRASLFVRSALLIGAGGIVFYDWRVVWPTAWRYRKEFIEHADEPEKADNAQEMYERYQQESFLLLWVLVFFLLGILLFSGATIRPVISTTLSTH